MDAVLIHPNNKADMRLLINIAKRMGAWTQIVEKEKIEELEDAALLAMMNQKNFDDDDESVSLEEVLKVLRK